MPPDDPSYTLRRVWLTPREEDGYYYGLANGALWPLCHIAYARPVFDDRDWREYVEVNRRFADTVLDEISNTKAIVFVQDYHFALLPRMIKEARPDAVVCQFWHIPWPNPEAFRICPWKETILDGLLGNDLLAFHIQYHCNNFLETVDRTLESRVDSEHFAVYRGGHRTFVKPYPISIDPALWSSVAPGPDWDRDVATTRRRLRVGDARLIMGVDRLDYTKGIPERLLAFERLLERRPEWLEQVAFLQIGAPTRDRLDQYQAFSAEVRARVQAINRRFGTKRWTPVVYRRQHHSPGGDRRLLPRRRRLRGVVAARRDEPGGQGVHRLAHRRGRRAAALGVHRRGQGAGRRRAGEPVRARRLRRGDARRPVDAQGGAAPPDAEPARRGAVAHRLRLGRPPAVGSGPAVERIPLTRCRAWNPWPWPPGTTHLGRK